MKTTAIFSQDDALAAGLKKQIDILTPSFRTIVFTDPLDLLLWITDSEDIVGIIIDVDSEACAALRLVRILRELDENIPLAFISSGEKYAVEAFEYGACGYLRYPSDDEKLRFVCRKLETESALFSRRRIYIRTFGSFELEIGGRTVIWKASKTKEMFALLIDARGADVCTEKIQHALWPDADLEKAAANYHTTTFNLRKKLRHLGLEEIIDGSRGSLRVDTSMFACDLYEFEQYAAEGSIESYRKAFELYRGKYLENHSYEWSKFTRVRIDMLFEQICHSL